MQQRRQIGIVGLMKTGQGAHRLAGKSQPGWNIPSRILSALNQRRGGGVHQ